jgi:hypothetical protein
LNTPELSRFRFVGSSSTADKEEADEEADGEAADGEAADGEDGEAAGRA